MMPFLTAETKHNQGQIVLPLQGSSYKLDHAIRQDGRKPPSLGVVKVVKRIRWNFLVQILAIISYIIKGRETGLRPVSSPFRLDKSVANLLVQTTDFKSLLSEAAARYWSPASLRRASRRSRLETMSLALTAER